MTHLTNINKQHGARILSRNAGLHVLPNIGTGHCSRETDETRIFAGNDRSILVPLYS
ncbi:hypothetical protein BMS3Abin13_01944 [bacterium BMS3Abin13]|nr:hypothetical protein BMS3Abin13_01944 [bacterium BMS3Abin13]